MRSLHDLSIEKSISRRWLVYRRSWMDYFNGLIIIIMAFQLIGITILLYLFELDFTNPNEQFIGYIICPILFTLGIYLLYRIFQENYLKVIHTERHPDHLPQLIQEFTDNEGYHLRWKWVNCFVFDKQIKRFTSYYHHRTLILILKDNYVFYTLIQDNHRVNFPTLFSHLFITHKLKKLLKRPIPIKVP